MTGESSVRDSVDTGEITLSEDRGIRYLHFGTPWVQGAMRLSRPYDIELEYVRQMMAWTLFLDHEAKHLDVLQLGLGAGALAKFCVLRCPHAQVTAVELSAEVIACGHSMFRVPIDHDRLRIVEAGAGPYVARPQVRSKFDVVQIDLYDAQARGPVEDSIAFYQDCRAAMKSVGVGVVNLFGEHDSYGRNLRRLREVFHGRVLALPQIEAANRVALVFQGPEIKVPFAQLYARARDIESTLGLTAKRWVDGLKKAVVEAGSDRRDGCLHI